MSEASLELFGMFAYEIRVGHQKRWSTAQARFGPPLRVAGVQHPAPPPSLPSGTLRGGHSDASAAGDRGPQRTDPAAAQRAYHVNLGLVVRASGRWTASHGATCC